MLTCCLITAVPCCRSAAASVGPGLVQASTVAATAGVSTSSAPSVPSVPDILVRSSSAEAPATAVLASEGDAAEPPGNGNAGAEAAAGPEDAAAVPRPRMSAAMNNVIHGGRVRLSPSVPSELVLHGNLYLLAFKPAACRGPLRSRVSPLFCVLFSTCCSRRRGLAPCTANLEPQLYALCRADASQMATCRPPPTACCADVPLFHRQIWRERAGRRVCPWRSWPPWTTPPAASLSRNSMASASAPHLAPCHCHAPPAPLPACRPSQLGEAWHAVRCV